jgi:hypothetical protein
LLLVIVVGDEGDVVSKSPNPSSSFDARAVITFDEVVAVTDAPNGSSCSFFVVPLVIKEAEIKEAERGVLLL